MRRDRVPVQANASGVPGGWPVWALCAASALAWVLAEAFGGPFALVCAKDAAFASAFAALLLCAVAPARGAGHQGAAEGRSKVAAAHAGMAIWLVLVAVTAAAVLPDSWLDSQATFSRRGPVVELAWTWIALCTALAVLVRHGRRARWVVVLALCAMLAAGATARWADAVARSATPDDFVGARALAARTLPERPTGADLEWVLTSMDYAVWSARAEAALPVTVGVSPLSEAPVYYVIERAGDGWKVAIHEGGGALLRRAAPGHFVLLWVSLSLGLGLAFGHPWLLGHPFVVPAWRQSKSIVLDPIQPTRSEKI
jgi:hypothetical protein